MCLRFSAAHITLLIPLNERKNSWGQTGSSQQVPGAGQSLLWLHGRYQNRGRSLAFLHSYIITQLKSFSKGQRQNFVSWKNKTLCSWRSSSLQRPLLCLLNFWQSFSSPLTLSAVAAGIQCFHLRCEPRMQQHWVTKDAEPPPRSCLRIAEGEISFHVGMINIIASREEHLREYWNPGLQKFPKAHRGAQMLLFAIIHCNSWSLFLNMHLLFF